MDSAAEEYFSAIHSTLSSMLMELSEEDGTRPTIRKNKLYDLSSINVLPQDQDFFLKLIDSALVNTQPINSLKPLIIFSKFGQKQLTRLPLSELLDLTRVSCISIHAACDIGSRQDIIHHFWSKYALQQLVGRCGKIFSAFSLREAVNFQSNMDGKAMDVHRDLKSIASFPDQINFLQLYADTPHNRQDAWHSHPVSGEIVCCGLMHHKTNAAMSSRSKVYLQHMADHLYKMEGIVTARVEIVMLVTPNQIQGTISGGEFLHVERLKKLVEQQPLLLPFKEERSGESFLTVMRGVAGHLLNTLKAAHASGKGQGKFTESWTAFQAEIGLEVFFWGHPTSRGDYIFATNLGPGPDNERSMTWQRGILGLAPINSATPDEGPPPLIYWTKEHQVQARIQRLFGFADKLEATFSVIGEELFHIILRGLSYRDVMYSVGIDDLTHDKPPHGRCTGIISAEQLLSELEQVRRFTYPATFSRAAALLEAAGKPLQDVLKAGLSRIGIKYFPAVKVIDASRNPKASWNTKDFWNVLAPKEAPTLHARAAVMERDVAVNMVNKGLTFAKNLEAAKENGMPWMEEVLRRLSGEKKLTREQLVQVCTFVSCVAFLQQHIFIDYQPLAKLESELPIPQAQLRLLQVQSKLLLPNVNKPKVWRIHDSIPIKVLAIKKPQLQPRPTTWHEHDPEVQEEDAEVEMQDNETENQAISHTVSMVLPASSKRVWSSQETDLVHESKVRGGTSVKAAYKVYVDLCFKADIPHRSIDAYKKKFRSL